MATIYVASKVKHADKWVALRAAGNPIISTWIDDAGSGWIDDAGSGGTIDYQELWTRMVREVTIADAVLVYCEDGEVQKGALVEVGAALSNNVPVFAVAPLSALKANGSWWNHPLVTLCADVQDALALIRLVRIRGGK